MGDPRLTTENKFPVLLSAGKKKAPESSGAEIGFVDRFSGTLIITGTVSAVQSAFDALADYIKNTLGYTVCQITKT